jgi:hypothetical protein
MRRNDWLTAQTVQRMQELLSAITDLSVSSKLKLIGLRPNIDLSTVEHSRTILVGFLDRLEEMIKRSRTTSAGLMLGADPELGAIARRFLASQGHETLGRDSGLDLGHLRSLLLATDDAELRELSEALAEFRELIEEHSHNGIAAVLGEV